MPSNKNYYKERWKASRVRFDLSYGMFDNDQMVGFIINAIDNRNGDYVAFNSGTGVIPKYRGKNIVKALYKHAIPKLRAQGITKCGLEVITENNIAVKTYERIGFRKSKYLVCVQGAVSVKSFDGITLEEFRHNGIDWAKIPNQDTYAWDFHHSALELGDYIYTKVYNQSEWESFFVIHREHFSVAQFEVLNNGPLVWERLFSAIATYSKVIKINNIDARCKEKLKAVETVGLVNTVNQFEMEMLLAD